MGRGAELAALEPHLPAHPLSAGDGPSSAARAGAASGLYAHVPFCARRCGYCDFSSGSLSRDAVERYLAGIEREAELRAPEAAGVTFRSVFFGGGTPSALSARHFGRLWKALVSRFAIAPDAEITLEANPETVKPALLDAWREAGVNRLSMGAQSFDPVELDALGRIHGPERPGEAFALARRHGFTRLSLDLMFGFPGNGRETWRATLESALALEPEHLSAYCFIPEIGTPLGAAALRGERALPEAEVQADLYETLVARLTAAGYGLYETSNFARPGGECRHNLVYWLRRDYLGLGPSAHSLWRGARYGNAYALETWAGALEGNRPWFEVEPESPASRADEVVMLGLRFGGGLLAADYPPGSWRETWLRYAGAFERALATGRLERVSGGYRIAPRHRFVADEITAWLMSEAERGRPRHRHDAAHLTVRAARP